jgi:DNA-binding ferritin-like protein
MKGRSPSRFSPHPSLSPFSPMESAFIELLTAQRNFAGAAHLSHLNVDGPQFYSFHLLFERVYEIVEEKIDGAAELARGYGVEIPAKIYHSVPELEWSTPEELTEELYDVAEDLCDSMKGLHKKADDAEEYAVLSFVEDLMVDMAKVKYLLGSVNKQHAVAEDEKGGEE